MIKRLGFDKYSALYLLVIFLVIFGFANDAYLNFTTFKLVIQENTMIAVLAMAFLFPLTTGTFDLAIGANMGLALVIVSKLAVNDTVPEWQGMIIAVAACAVGGWVAGFLVVRLKVNSFIATLGMSQVIEALRLYISPQSIQIIPFTKGYRAIGTDKWLGMQRYVFFMLILLVILWYVLEHTPLGRYMFATGGNPEAARLAGVRTDRLIWGSLVVSGVLGGFAGIIYSWKIGTYSQNVGPGLLFPAIAAVFFGASQLKGRANVWGTMIALYALAFGVHGLSQRYLNSTWIDPMFSGVSLILAVSLASRHLIVKVRKRRVESLPSDGAMATAVPEAPAAG